MHVRWSGPVYRKEIMFKREIFLSKQDPCDEEDPLLTVLSSETIVVVPNAVFLTYHRQSDCTADRGAVWPTCGTTVVKYHTANQGLGSFAVCGTQMRIKY